MPEVLSTNMRVNYFTGLSYEARRYDIIVIIHAMKEFRPVNLLDVRDQCIFVEFRKLGQWIESLECDQL